MGRKRRKPVTATGFKGALARFVQEGRRTRGMSQGALAAKLRKTPSSVSAWETGERGVTSEVFEALARAFDLDLDRALRILSEIAREQREERERLAADLVVEKIPGPGRAYAFRSRADDERRARGERAAAQPHGEGDAPGRR